MSPAIEWLLWILGSLTAFAGFGVAWFAFFRDRARGRPRCPRCWYSLEGAPLTAGLPLPTCPECGHTAARRKRLFRTRRHLLRAAIGVLLVVVGTGLGVWPTVRSRDAISLVPTPMLYYAWMSESYRNSREVESELSYHRAANLSFSRPMRWWITGRAINTLYNDPEPINRDHAGSLLAWIGARDARITPALIGRLNDPDPSVRVRIIRSFRIYSADASAVVPRLIAIAQDDSEATQVREEAIGTLGSRYGLLSRDVLPTVAQSLASPVPSLRTAAASAVGSFGPVDPSVIARLIQIAGDSTDPAQESAVHSLGVLRSVEAVPVLTIAIGSQNIGVHMEAIRAIGQIGPAASAAALSLAAVAGNSATELRIVVLAQAASASVTGSAPDLAHALAVRLRDRDPVLRQAAASEIRRLGPEAVPIFPELIAALDDADDMTASIVCSIFGNLGKCAEAALPRLKAIRETQTMADFGINGIERCEFALPTPGP